MNLERVFKSFILANVSLFVFMIPAIIFEPEEITTISESLDSGILESDLGMIIGCIWLISYWVALFLLYRFVNLGKTLFSLVLVFSLIFVLFSGSEVSNPLQDTLDSLSGIVDGGILVFLYFTPIKDKFAK
jgi:hypothetical protein